MILRHSPKGERLLLFRISFGKYKKQHDFSGKLLANNKIRDATDAF
jgi:hypothetical protein